MWDLCRLIVGLVTDLFRSRVGLEAELLVLRRQINVLRRKAPKKLFLGSIDRLILACACRFSPNAFDALAIVRPDTVVRWHRAGFRSYWRWKSRFRPGRARAALRFCGSFNVTTDCHGGWKFLRYVGADEPQDFRYYFCGAHRR